MIWGLQYRAHLPPRWSDTSASSLSPLRPSTNLTKGFLVIASGDIVAPNKVYKDVKFQFEYTTSPVIEPSGEFLRMLNEEDFKIPPLKRKIWAAHPITFYSAGWFLKGIHKLPSFKGVDAGFSTVPFEEEGKPWWGEYYDASLREYYNPPPEWAFAEDARSYFYTGNPNDPRVVCPALIHSHVFDKLRYFIRFFDTVYILKPTEYARRRFYRLVEEELPSIMRILQGLSWLEEVPVPDALKEVPLNGSGVFLNISLGESYFLSWELVEGEETSTWDGLPTLPTPSFYPKALQDSTQRTLLESTRWTYSPYKYTSQPYPVQNFKVNRVGLSLYGFINALPNMPWDSEDEWLANILTSGGHNQTFASYTTGYYDSWGNWVMPPFIDVPTPLLVWSGTSGSFIIGNPLSEDVPAENITRVFLRGLQRYEGQWHLLRYKVIIALTTVVNLAFVSFKRIREDAKVYAPPKKETIAKAVHPYFEVEDVFVFPLGRYLDAAGRKPQFKPRDYVRHVDYLSVPDKISGQTGTEKLNSGFLSVAILPTGDSSNVHIWGDDVPWHDFFNDNLGYDWGEVDLGRDTRDWLENHLKVGFAFAVRKIKEWFTQNKFVHSLMPPSDVTCTALRTIEGAPRSDLPITITTEKEIIKLGDYMQKVGGIYTPEYRGGGYGEDGEFSPPQEYIPPEVKIKRYITSYVPIGVYSVAPDYEGSFTNFLNTLKGKNAIPTDYPLTWSPKLVNFSGGAVSPPELQYIPAYMVRERPQIGLSYDLLGKRNMIRLDRETRWIFWTGVTPQGTEDETKDFFFYLLRQAKLRSLIETDFVLFEYNANIDAYVVKRYTQPIIVGAYGGIDLLGTATDTRVSGSITLSAQATQNTLYVPFFALNYKQVGPWMPVEIIQRRMFEKDWSTPLLLCPNYTEYYNFWASVWDTVFSDFLAYGIYPPLGVSDMSKWVKDLTMYVYRNVGNKVMLLRKVPLELVSNWVRPKVEAKTIKSEALNFFKPSYGETAVVKPLGGLLYPNIPFPVNTATGEIYIPDTRSVKLLNLFEPLSPLSRFEGEERRIRTVLPQAYLNESFIPYRRRAKFRIRKQLEDNSIFYYERADIGLAISSYMLAAPLVPPTITELVSVGAFHPEVFETRRLFSTQQFLTYGVQVGRFVMNTPSTITFLASKAKPKEAYLHSTVSTGAILIQSFGIPPHQRDKDRNLGDSLWGTLLLDLDEWVLQSLPVHYFRCYDIPPYGAVTSLERVGANPASAFLQVKDEYFIADTGAKIRDVDYLWIADELVDKKRVPLENQPVLLEVPEDVAQLIGTGTEITLYHPQGATAYDTVYCTLDGYRVGYFKRKGFGDIEPERDGSVKRDYYPQISWYAWEEVWLNSGTKTVGGEEYVVHRLEPRHPVHWRIYLLLALPDRAEPSATMLVRNGQPVFCSYHPDSFYDIVPIAGVNPLRATHLGWVQVLTDPSGYKPAGDYDSQLLDLWNRLGIGEKRNPALIGMQAFKELKETVVAGMNSLWNLAKYFPEVSKAFSPEERARIIEEESLTPEESQRWDTLLKATARIWEIPQYSIFALYYGWDRNMGLTDTLRSKWQAGEPLPLDERAPIVLLVMPKYPTLSFPFYIDAPVGEVKKMFGFVRTPPAPPAETQKYSYIELYLHYLRGKLYQKVKKERGDNAAEAVCPAFNPLSFVNYWDLRAAKYWAEYKDYVSAIEQVEKLLSVRWSELNSTVFVYPHVPHHSEISAGASPILTWILENLLSMLRRKEVKAQLDLRNYAQAIFSAWMQTELRALSGLEDLTYTHGRNVPLREMNNVRAEMNLRGLPLPLPCGGYHVPATLLYRISFVYYSDEKFLEDVRKETTAGEIKSQGQGITISLRMSPEGLPQYYYTMVMTGAHLELPYHVVTLDFTLNILKEITEERRKLFIWRVFERFPSEPGLIIYHTEFSKTSEDTYTIVQFGEYKQDLWYPKWDLDAGDEIFKWHYDRVVGDVQAKVNFWDFPAEETNIPPLPLNMYAILDRVVLPLEGVKYPFADLWGVDLKVNDFRWDSFLALLEEILCLRPRKFPTLELKRDEVSNGAWIGKFYFPIPHSFLFKFPIKNLLKEMVGEISTTVQYSFVGNKLETFLAQDLLMFLIWTAFLRGGELLTYKTV